MGDPTGRPGGAGDEPWSARVRSELLDRRVVTLRGALDDDLAGRIVAELMMLDATGDEPVTLYVDSQGGPLHAAFGVIDTIDLLGAPVEAVCVGRAEGSAVGVVAAAPRRRASTHARFHLSEPSSSVTGRAGEIEAWAVQHQAELARFVDRLAAGTGRPAEHVEADLAAGRWLQVEEALAYGLIDGIWTSTRPPRPFGFGPGTAGPDA